MSEGTEKQLPPAEPVKTTPPEPFGSSYEKAHRAYGLTAALLLGWELIGIDLSDKPFPTLDVKLKSPQAVPWVLLALLCYFAFRYTIEWYQADPARRRVLAARIDFAVAHFIGVLAVLVLAIQIGFKTQIANQLGSPTVRTIFIASIGGVGVATVVSGIRRALRHRKKVATKMASKGFVSVLDSVGFDAAVRFYRRQLVLGSVVSILAGSMALAAVTVTYRWLFWSCLVLAAILASLVGKLLTQLMPKVFLWSVEEKLKESMEKLKKQ